MLLNEIKAGTSILLEVVTGSKKFDIPLIVERVDQFALLTNTFRYGGNVVNFNGRGFEHLLFNVYASDAGQKNRFVWKGVVLECVTVRGIPYYSIKSKNIVQHGVETNRRGENRLELNIGGQVFSNETSETAFATIHDVSSQGISFYVPAGFATVGDIVDVRFIDQVADHTFDIGVEAQVVRVVAADRGKELCGCKLRAPNREMLSFICLRQIIEKKKEKNLDEGNGFF